MVPLILFIFFAAYVAIVFSHSLKINKTAPALLSGVCCWLVYILFTPDKELVIRQLLENLGDYSGILFFLMGAMTIVEIIDAHEGFDIITNQITQTNKKQLLWLIALLTFFLSPILDNLTTTIVMISLMQKPVKNQRDQLYFAGAIVIVANAGGAWSPIGDVTTTMLWLGGQVSALHIVQQVFFPAVVSMIIPVLIISSRLKGTTDIRDVTAGKPSTLTNRHRKIVLLSGVGLLLAVPAFKAITHLPPFMGILGALAIMWIITEIIAGKKNEDEQYFLSPAYALRRIDTASILFFLGILLSIAALERADILSSLARTMEIHIADENAIAGLLGLLSAVIDNVPLVAAAQGMYPLSQYPIDHTFWGLLAFCTGTGGSLLIVGSAAGIAAMGMIKITFIDYLKKISWIALAGTGAGAAAYFFQQYLLS